MPQGAKVLGKPIDEEKWAKAKEIATSEGHSGDYAYIMGVYKRMTRLGKSTMDNLNTVQKPHDQDHLRLALIKGDLEEFRCSGCNALLFKGLNLEKSIIEVKCRSCGIILVSPGLLVLE
jgi:hypothetical protein